MRIVYFLAIILISLLLRFQEVSKGLPYFYDEDEAHHFNRVVSMVQRGTFDPEYFHKPSLHFYLRMPVVALGFLWGVKEGHLRSISEIKTKDPEGVGGYAFSTSHQGIAKWNRAFSLLLSILAIGIVYFIAVSFELPALIAALTALLCAVSPALISQSAVIGVDVLVVFFCIACSYFALLNLHTRAESFLFLSSVSAGLAIGSKYNALPIVIVPMMTALLGVSGVAGFLWAAILAGITFFLTTPYLFAHIPLFLDHVAYEIWHYKIAGHEGHSAQPGLEQAQFFFNFFTSQALSFAVVIVAVIGFFAAFKNDRKKAFILALFPLAYFLLMVGQKTNFTRNMLVVIPYLALFAGIGVFTLLRRFRAAQVIVMLLLVGTVIPKTYAYLHSTRNAQESRATIVDALKADPQLEFAIDNRLQVSGQALQQANASAVTLQAPEILYLKGFDRLIQMTSAKQRIINNPAIDTVNLDEISLSPEAKRELIAEGAIDSVVLHRKDAEFICQNPNKDLCWINTRLGNVALEDIRNAPGFSGINGFVSVNIKLFSPWKQEGLKISFGDFLADISLSPLEAGVEKEFTLNLPYQELKDLQGFYLSLNKIKRPAPVDGMKKNQDSRRLGVAILAFSINRR